MKRSIWHYKEWGRACKGRQPASSNFNHGGPLTEILLLGIAAIRADAKLHWDARKMEIPNLPEANQFLHHPYRGDWSL